MTSNTEQSETKEGDVPEQANNSEKDDEDNEDDAVKSTLEENVEHDSSEFARQHQLETNQNKMENSKSIQTIDREAIPSSVHRDHEPNQVDPVQTSKRHSTLIPRFRTNKLEPLNTNKLRGSKSSRKMMKRPAGHKKGNKQAKEKTNQNDMNMSSQDPNAKLYTVVEPLSLDSKMLSNGNKVIFAVPNVSGQQVIPIEISFEQLSQIARNMYFKRKSVNNIGGMLNELKFEVMWRNLVYYHLGNRSLPKSLFCCLSRMFTRKNAKQTKLDSNGQTSPSTTLGRPTLNNISGTFSSGQMTAIMGPSGAGKTVFLNCISGFLRINTRKENSGDIMINGVRSVRIGFVEQFDQLLPHLTVRETLLFASRIKNAARFYLNHNKIVDNVISRLDLSDFSNMYTSRCSNGQRKRLSIAIELVFNSDILILDEPTTGLDTVTGFQIMNTLKLLTKRRKAIAILATIHQPSPKIFELFDNLIVLSREGKIIYQGHPEDVSRTMQLVGLSCPMYSSMSDFVLEVASGDFGSQSLHLLTHYNNEYNRNQLTEDLNEVEMNSLQEAVKRANRVDQRSVMLCTWLLLWRNILCNFRNPLNSRIRLISLLTIAFFLSIIFTDIVGTVSTCPPSKYYLWQLEMSNVLKVFEQQQYHAQENLAVMFMMSLVALFNSMMNLVVTFPDEVRVFRREYNNYSYTIFSYFVAKMLGDIPFTLPTTTLFVMIVHRLTGQPLDTWSRIYLSVLPCCLVTIIGQLMGMLIGVMFYESQISAIYTVIFVLIPILLCSGFFKLIRDMHYIIAHLSYVSFLRPSTNAIMVANYGLDRCQYEYRNEEDMFASLNKSNERPDWINSMTTLIDFQLGVTDSNDSMVLKWKNSKLNKEDKLIQYMGFNIEQKANSTELDRTAMVLQHFSLGSDYQAYWRQIYELLGYILVFTILLYATMKSKLSRKKN